MRVGATVATHASVGTAEFTCAEELQDTFEPVARVISTARSAHALDCLHIRTAYLHDTAFYWLLKRFSKLQFISVLPAKTPSKYNIWLKKRLNDGTHRCRLLSVTA